jgi:hypothetical protein
MLADGFRSLKKQDEADRFVQDLHSAVEQQMAADMRTQSEDMLHILIDLNAKLKALALGEKLNHEQALEREILMIARRLQLETQAEAPADQSSTSAQRRERRARGASETAATAGAIEEADSKKDQATTASDGETKTEGTKAEPAGGRSQN